MTSIQLRTQAHFVYLRRKELEMSAGWIFIGLLLISPFYEAKEVKDESTKTNSRHRRSIMNLNDMVKAVTGRDGQDFVPYGNYCGIGGEGQPVDPVDECCQNHDICYDIAKSGVCKDHGDKSIYQLEYKWHVADDETAICEDEKDQCKMTICICDAIITNCLKSNIDFYDPQHKKEWDLFQLFEGMEALEDSKK